MLDKIFLQILNMSFTASYVILLVLLARLLLKKVPKIFLYALWSIVFFRLVCPFSFESNLSWFHLTGRTIEQMRPFPEKFTTLNNALPTANATIELSPIAETSMSFVSGIFTLLWLVGIVALLLYSAASLFRLRHKLIGAVKLRDNIYLADHIQSPFVIGVMRPKIYLPSTLSEREQGYIILHEQTHIKRFDHIVKILAFCTLCVHWFNPLVWLAFILCVKDMEMSCDESVMKQMNTDIRNEYSASLLSLATGKKMIAGTPLAFGEGDTTSRIKNVINYKKPAFWVVAVSVIAVVAVGIGLMANPKSNTTNPYGSSAKDVLNRYTLALAASDITGMRHFMPTLNPPAQDVIDVWKQIKIESVEVLKEDIRENKAEFKLSVTVKEAPDGFGMWTPGTATHYLYVEKCDSGWYVESYGAGGRSQSDLDAWWSQPNLIDSATAFDFKPYDTFAFSKLAPTQTEMYKETLTFSSDNTELTYVATWTPSGLSAEIGLISQDGTEYLVGAVGGSAKGSIKDIPAGTYQVVLRNSKSNQQYTKGNENITGSMAFDLKPMLIEKDTAPLNAMRPMIMVDSILYLDTGKEVSIKTDDNAILGKITSAALASEKPTENGQCNFSSGVGAKYAAYEDGMTVFLDNKWFFFEKDTETTDIGVTAGAKLSSLPKEYSSSMAIKNGDYVDVHGNISNSEAMDYFISAVSKKEKAFIRTTIYTKEGDPIITDFDFDGKSFSVYRDTTRDKFGNQEIKNYTYQNLVPFIPDSAPKTQYFYITNLSEITQKDFEEGVDGVVIFCEMR